ncbi:response regulator transcription factor [Geodermatophilus obscurus]|uniref:Response regulator receiver protein n=1 Tax=Geodermatophilus obscurus (strain ATCC 25078 / DSM 43160 / JCM 3152 / CCUG 61914 / KCC A-0152 / KCTC 9177 / NBRC 13315 / NRRL B-3577 / G-20) TaxID=526225 RepID=D2S4W8_GEOOG|nr:response regulator [Geodermatophilus obscurus]ADB73079.1 response regulator receiver protein [Geodermatophilus obscurus DSM 43160]
MPHVLVVDDDPVVADLVAFRLQRLGLQVTVRTDGETGLAAARRLRPDLVVLDWLMPRMDGLEVCRALRADADPALARTPVLMLTAKSQEPDLERGFAAGATDFVAKPFSTRELVSRVTAALPAVPA